MSNHIQNGRIYYMGHQQYFEIRNNSSYSSNNNSFLLPYFDTSSNSKKYRHKLIEY